MGDSYFCLSCDKATNARKCTAPAQRMNYGCNYTLVNIFHGLVVSSCQAHAAQVAQQHYNQQLKKKVWLGWHALIQKHWKVKVEQACRARAEEVCAQLSTEYEAKLAEVNKDLRMEQQVYGDAALLNSYLTQPPRCVLLHESQHLWSVSESESRIRAESPEVKTTIATGLALSLT